MKVRELMEELSALDQDADVHFTYNYGDHWRTMVVEKIKSVDECEVEYSEYHKSLALTGRDGDDDEDDDTEHKSVIVLRS